MKSDGEMVWWSCRLNHRVCGAPAASWRFNLNKLTVEESNRRDAGKEEEEFVPQWKRWTANLGSFRSRISIWRRNRGEKRREEERDKKRGGERRRREVKI